MPRFLFLVFGLLWLLYSFLVAVRPGPAIQALRTKAIMQLANATKDWEVEPLGKVLLKAGDSAMPPSRHPGREPMTMAHCYSASLICVKTRFMKTILFIGCIHLPLENPDGCGRVPRKASTRRILSATHQPFNQFAFYLCY